MNKSTKPNKKPTQDFNEDFKNEWIKSGINKDCIDFAQKLGEYLCDLNDKNKAGFHAMSTSQIRNFFSEVKRIQRAGIETNKAAFHLIKPKLAYSEARAIQKNRSNRIVAFRKYVELAHDAVEIDKEEDIMKTQFQRFVDFLEAILAYHKAFGGRD